jgi:hypothetical protein
MILSPAIVTEVLRTIVCGMCHRLFNIPLSLADFNEEKKYIYETASKNGFVSSFVDKIFKKHELKFIRNQSTALFTHQPRINYGRYSKNIRYNLSQNQMENWNLNFLQQKTRQPKTKNLEFIRSAVEQKTVTKNTFEKQRGH